MKVASFLDGDARVLFHGMFFPRMGFILAGLSHKTSALSLSPLSLSIYLCLPFISILYFPPRRHLLLVASPWFDKLWRFCTYTVL